MNGITYQKKEKNYKKMYSEAQFVVLVNNCLLPKIVKKNDECDVSPFYSKYQNELEKKIERIFSINDESLRNLSSNALASVFLLYNEMLSPGLWSNDHCRMLANRLNEHFQTFNDISLSHLLSTKQDNVDKQEVFNTCMMKLHLKLTSDDFKKYPGQTAVYCRLIGNLQEYQVNKDLLNLIPISLLLIDDFEREYKLKGLKCLHKILHFLKLEDFKNGNYYEVIYGTLKKSIHEKDKEITELVLQCFLKLLLILPPNVKMNKCDDSLACALEELSLESNLYRKAIYIRFTKEILRLIGVDCVKWKKKSVNVFCDNLEVCLNKEVADILLADIIECLEEWIRHSWCVWKYETDKKLLIYVTKSLVSCDQQHKSSLGRILETLVRLSTPDEQIKIVNDFRNMLDYIKSQADPTTDKDVKSINCLSKLAI